jgi:hypothetical protein
MKYESPYQQKLQAIAVTTFRAAIVTENRRPWWAAQDAWQAVRKADGRLRAPWWDEALATNNGVRSYRSPLGEVLGIDDEVGSHSTRFKRPERSLFEVECLRERVLGTLVRLAFPNIAERRKHNLVVEDASVSTIA